MSAPPGVAPASVTTPPLDDEVAPPRRRPTATPTSAPPPVVTPAPSPRCWRPTPSTPSWRGSLPGPAGSVRSSRCWPTPRSPRSWSTPGARCGSSAPAASSRTEVRLAAGVAEQLIERVVAPLGLRIDRTAPVVDARLPDGSRVHAVIPPLAVDGACLTIRRFAAQPVALSRFAPPPLVALVGRLVAERRNVLVSGATSSGKTTLLNAIGALLPPAERVITIEDAAELRLPGRHVVRLEARRATADGVGAVTVQDLLRAALRMRPDRIVVGEVRGGEALDMVAAMNTGHDGSLSTCHANSAGRRPAPGGDDGAPGRQHAARRRRARAGRRRRSTPWCTWPGGRRQPPDRRDRRGHRRRDAAGRATRPAPRPRRRPGGRAATTVPGVVGDAVIAGVARRPRRVVALAGARAARRYGRRAPAPAPPPVRRPRRLGDRRSWSAGTARVASGVVRRHRQRGRRSLPVCRACWRTWPAACGAAARSPRPSGRPPPRSAALAAARWRRWWPRPTGACPSPPPAPPGRPQRPSPRSRLAAVALGVAAETGGAQARAVDAVAATLRERLAVHADVRAQSSQARLSATVIALLPVAFVVWAASPIRGWRPSS